MTFFRRFRFGAILMCMIALTCFPIVAQTAPPPPSVDTTVQPEYFIAAGAGFNQYSADSKTAGWLTAARRVANRTYTLASIDQTPQRATMRAGAAYMLSQRGPVSIFALGDAGAATGSATNFAATGGGMVAISLASRLKAPVYLVGAIRVMRIAGTAPGGGVLPVYEFGVGYGQ